MLSGCTLAWVCSTVAGHAVSERSPVSVENAVSKPEIRELVLQVRSGCEEAYETLAACTLPESITNRIVCESAERPRLEYLASCK